MDKSTCIIDLAKVDAVLDAFNRIPFACEAGAIAGRDVTFDPKRYGHAYAIVRFPHVTTQDIADELYAKLTEMLREEGFAATDGLDGEDDGGYYYGIDIANG